MAKKTETTKDTSRETPKVKLMWRDHDDQSVRVWRTDWSGDQFEVISKPAFGTFRNVLERFTLIEVEQAEDE